MTPLKVGIAVALVLVVVITILIIMRRRTTTSATDYYRDHSRQEINPKYFEVRPYFHEAHLLIDAILYFSN